MFSIVRGHNQTIGVCGTETVFPILAHFLPHMPANKKTDSQLDVPFYSEVLDMLEVNWTKLDINWTKLNKTELFILEM